MHRGHHGTHEASSFSDCCTCFSKQGIFDVLCYGAKGDGQTDDLGAILAARDAVNAAGGITIDPILSRDHPDHDQTQDSYATVASNVCVANQGPGIHTTHAGYLAVYGNICDGNDNAGIGIVSSRYAVVADNVLTGNSNGVGFFADAGVQDVGHHLLVGNVYDRNTHEIQIGEKHPAIRQLQDRWPHDGPGGLNLPVKTTAGDPAGPVDGLLYLNTDDNNPQPRVYAGGAWHTLQ